LGEEKIAQTQTLIEIANTETFIYTRAIIILPTQDVKNWTRLANNLDIETLETTIQSIIVGQLQEIYVTQTQFTTALNLKQDTLPNGTSEEYVRGDKTIGILSTDAVIEGTNQNRLYHSEARVRATTLTGYTEIDAVTTATDNVLQALGKKVDRITVNTALDLKANLDSPSFTGTPTAPTPATNNNSTNIATTAYVNNKISSYQTTATNDIKSVSVTYTAEKLTFVKYVPISGAGAIYINGLVYTSYSGILMAWVNVGDTYMATGNNPLYQITEFN
jgi:hypothetical protein